MSLYAYEESKQIAAMDPSFDALIMAAMRKADSDNLSLLHGAFPRLLHELQARYNAPGGRLPSDGPEPTLELVNLTDEDSDG